MWYLAIQCAPHSLSNKSIAIVLGVLSSHDVYRISFYNLHLEIVLLARLTKNRLIFSLNFYTFRCSSCDLFHSIRITHKWLIDWLFCVYAVSAIFQPCNSGHINDSLSTKYKVIYQVRFSFIVVYEIPMQHLCRKYIALHSCILHMVWLKVYEHLSWVGYSEMISTSYTMNDIYMCCEISVVLLYTYERRNRVIFN